MPRSTPTSRKKVDIENSVIAKRAGYTEILKKIQREGLCPFCEENVIKYHPNPILFKNSHWIVTTNAWPYEGSKHHFLLISRKHIESAAEATPESWKSLGTAFKKICRDQKLTGESLFMRSGDSRMTGASVSHLHAQIVAGSVRNKNSAPILALMGFNNKKQ